MSSRLLSVFALISAAAGCISLQAAVVDGANVPGPVVSGTVDFLENPVEKCTNYTSKDEPTETPTTGYGDKYDLTTGTASNDDCGCKGGSAANLSSDVALDAGPGAGAPSDSGAASLSGDLPNGLGSQGGSGGMRANTMSLDSVVQFQDAGLPHYRTGLSAGCAPCGSSTDAMQAMRQQKIGVPDISRGRSLHPRQMALPASFGPGQFAHFDIRLRFEQIGDERFADLFDPKMLGNRRFTDGPYNHSAIKDIPNPQDGVFTDEKGQSAKSLVLKNAAGQTVTEVADASTALLTTHDGYTVDFEIINLAQGGIQPSGQAVDLSFGEGSGTTSLNTGSAGGQATLTGVTWITGPQGSALSLAGATSAVTLPGYQGVGGGNARTLAAWIKPASDAEMAILAWGDNVAGQKWVLRTHDAGVYGTRLRLEVNGGYIVGEADLADGAWHHVAAVLPDVVDPQVSAIQLYVDGQLQQISAVQSHAVDTATATGLPLTIGNDHANRFFTGEIDEVQVYNRALSIGEVQALSQVDAIYAGRVTSMQDRNGYGTTIAYQYQTSDDLQGSPSRLWQVATITDANDETTTISYKPQQIAGHWVVDTMDLPDGNQVSYDYGANGMLDTVTHADGAVSTFSYTYDAASKTTKIGIEDGSGTLGQREVIMHVSNAVTIEPNTSIDGRQVIPQAAGQIRSVANGEGEVTYLVIPKSAGFESYVYTGAGRLRRVHGTDKDQYATSWSLKNNSGTYNSINFTGEATSVSYQFDSKHNWRHWYRRNAKSGTDLTGRKVKYLHDDNGRIKKATHPDNTYETWERNAFNLVTRYRDREGRITITDYDSRGNKTQETRPLKVVNGVDTVQPETGVWRWEYYPAGHPNQFLLQYSYDANNNRTDYLYDAQHRLVSVISPPDGPNDLRAEVTFTYETAGGRVATMTDPESRTVVFGYTDGGRLKSLRYDDTSTEAVVISDGSGTVSAGLVETYTDRNGNVMTCGYDDAGRRTSCVTAGPDEQVIRSIRTAYVNGSRLVAWNQTDDMVTWFTYDYRGREASRTVFPQVDPTQDTFNPNAPGALTSSVTYVKNRVDTRTDPYGRRTFYLYNVEDMVDRTVRETIPGAIAAGTNLRNLTRDLSANASYLITDRKYDHQTHDLLQSTDGRGIIDTFAYDLRSRLETQVLSAKVLNAGSNSSATTISDKTVARRTEFDYDAQGNVTEIRHPRYFDPNDPQGSNQCRDRITYTGRNLRATRIEAYGHPTEAATESWTYHLDGRLATATDFRGNTTTYLYHPCCGRLLAVIDPLGNGTISHTDYHGNITHTAVVEDLPLTVLGYSWRNPVDAKTLNETTTRYDARHRPIYRTAWLEPLGEVNPNTVPIAGLGTYPASMGLTTRFVYDDDLSDGLGFAGLIPYTIDITGLQSGSARGFINPEGEVSVQLTDGLGRALRSYNGEGHLVSSTAYDALSDGSETTGSGSTVTAGLLITAGTDAVGSTTASYSDGAARTRFVKDAENYFSAASFDANNNRLSVRDGNDVGQDCVYDFADRDTSCTDTAGDVISRAYDAAGMVIIATDGRGKDTVSTYDVRGRKVTVLDRVLGLTRFTYDANSNLESIMDADADPGNPMCGGGGETTEYRYDERNLLVFESFPGHQGGETSQPGDVGYDARTYSYDGARRLISRIDQVGDETTYEYDLANRLEFRRYPDSKDDSFTYDDASRLLTAESERYANSVIRTYFDDGALASESLGYGAETYLVSYVYDDANRRTDLVYPSGRTATWSYTPRHQIDLVQFGQAGSQTTVVSETIYDAGRRLTDRSLGNGLELDRTWRTDNLADTITVTNPDTNAVIIDFAYFYDANKRKTEERDLAPGMTTYTQTFGYDDEDRLTVWGRPGQPGVAQTWNLSKVGDWKDTTKNGVLIDHGHNPVHEITSYDVEGAPAMPGPSHDAKGNMTTNPARGQTYTWDFENRMTSATDGGATFNATYAYDALGRRVAKTVDGVTRIFVCAGAQVVAEYETSVAPANPDTEYVYGAYVDEPLVMRKADGPLYYYHANHLYSVAAITDDTGVVTERYGYDSYGDRLALDATGTSTPTTPLSEYGFTGRRLDSETGLWYFRARHFDSKLGRFVGRDPLGYVDGLLVYRGYFAPNALDPTGTIFGNHQGSNIDTSFGFLFHYAYGGGRAVNLRETGVFGEWLSIVGRQLADVRETGIWDNLPDNLDCYFNEGTFSGSFGGEVTTPSGVNGGPRGNEWDAIGDNVYVMGQSWVTATFTCNIHVECQCCPEYGYGNRSISMIRISGCTINWSLRDHFDNPLDRGGYDYHPDHDGYRRCIESCQPQGNARSRRGLSHARCRRQCYERYYAETESFLGGSVQGMPYEINADWTESVPEWNERTYECGEY